MPRRVPHWDVLVAPPHDGDHRPKRVVSFTPRSASVRRPPGGTMQIPLTRTIRCALLATLLAVAATGCYKATFISNPRVVKGADHDQWNSFFLWGLVGEESLDVRQFCSGGQV